MSRFRIVDMFSRQKSQEEDHSDVERFLKAMFGSEEFIPQRDRLGLVLADGEGEISDEEMEWICAAGYGELRNDKRIKDKNRYLDI